MVGGSTPPSRTNEMTKILYSLDSLKDFLKKNKPSSICLITSDKLLKKLDWAIKGIASNDLKVITIPDGEDAKEWNQVENVLKKFIEFKIDRNSIILTLGGGTVGDLVGFSSSIFLRGIRYIQIPTTLLAQVDSAHGGKTGINFSGYKNQVGSFHEPLAIVIDTRFIKTLSSDQIEDGLGEIIKAGLIKDKTILSLLKNENVNTLSKSKKLIVIIKNTIKVKDFYTKSDYKDTGVRQILNVGHTIGHAIELKYKFSHGKAVIIGIMKELEISEMLGLTPMSVRKNLEILLNKLVISVDKKTLIDWDTVLHDKKIKGDSIAFPFIKSEGKAGLVNLKLETLKKILTK